MSAGVDIIEFSVIIPAYNVADYIPQCIESVLNQSYDNYEIVIVNDGSKDNTLPICHQYANRDKRIRIIDKANGGVSAARKDAVEAASGRYLIFLDADDWLDSGCFEALYNVIVDSDPDIVVYGEYVSDADGNFSHIQMKYAGGLYNKTKIESDIYPRLIQDERATCFSTSIIQKAIKRELFKSHLLSNKEAPIGEDGACLIPCIYNASSIYILHKPFYYYRYNENSATKSRKVFNWSCPEIINRHIEKHVDMLVSDFKSQIYRKIVHDVFNVVVSRFYQDFTYMEIVKDIDVHLENDYYKEAIKNAKFAGSYKAQLMALALKHKLYFLIYILSKVK